ncbi:MAG: branched-chain amino acid ABC transporter permease [Alphaproteobacteria bacterium]|nr:branched-chain amino acid ABC transporter permease [Alphaproteobacteria bacterium]
MNNVLQAVVDAASVGGIYALMALGIGLIFGIVRLVNFAHGEFVMVGGYAVLLLAGAPTVAVIAATLIVVVVLALGVERIAFRPLRGAAMPTLLVGSFAVSYFIQHVVMMSYGGNTVGVDFMPKLSESIEFGGVSVPALQLVAIVVTVLLLAGLAYFLKATLFGIEMRAAAEDLRMARLLGVPTNLIIALAFAISGLLAAVVAVVYVAQIGVLTPRMGVQPALIGFVATVVGGMGSLLGAVVGGFLIGTITVVLQIILPLELRDFRDAFLFGSLFLILLVRPQGLIVVRAARERV